MCEPNRFIPLLRSSIKFIIDGYVDRQTRALEWSFFCGLCFSCRFAVARWQMCFETILSLLNESDPLLRKGPFSLNLRALADQ